MFIDTHAHTYSEYYDDIKTIIAKSNSDGINLIINSGTDRKSNEEVISLCNKFEEMYATVGIHPEYASEYHHEDLLKLQEHLDNPKVLAIGEIGLDYHYEGYDKQKQVELFKAQLKMAEEHHLPVVIHSRDATQDTLDILKEYSVRGIIHSFSGSKEIALEYIKLGYKLGINGVVTFKNAHLKDVIKEVGVEHIVLETDSPYLTPMPFRGKQNYPGNIKYIVNFLADYLQISASELSNITNKNAQEIFDKL